MKTTYEWIKTYVPDFEGDVDEMCDRFTMSGSEVEYHLPGSGDDRVIELSITSNRVDCLGMVGLARDLAAVTGLPLRMPDMHLRPGDAAVEDACSVELQDEKGCSRYTALVVEGISVGPSPDWLVERLESIGLRSVNNVVDVTNFVLFEMNQPFHVFDLEQLDGSKIIVRRAIAGEKIRAINDREYELDPEMTVIADASRPVAIAGVMGGADTEVSERTTRVLLETARFDPLATRHVAKKLALNSDSSFRFERGVDGHGIDAAANRCARLILEVAGGSLRKGMIDVGAPEPCTRQFSFRHAQVERVTGIEIPWERCREILESLGCRVIGGGDPTAPVPVEVPTWRRDLEREIDLVEEIIRIHGLDQIPADTKMTVVSVADSKLDLVRAVVKRNLVAAGFAETLTTPFLAPASAAECFFADHAPIEIRNAMRKDESALRMSLLTSLLTVRRVNQDNGNGDGIRIFEVTVVYLDNQKGEIPLHLPILGGLIDGDFAAARGALELLGRALGLKDLCFEIMVAEAGALEAGVGARVLLGEATIGFVGQPTARKIAEMSLKNRPQYFELRLDHIVEAASLTPKFEAFSRYPAAHRDLAVIVDESRTWGEIEKLVRSLDLPDLESLEFFDEFRGKQLGAGKKSLAFSLSYRSSKRTLTSEEVEASQQRAIAAMAKELGAQIRDQ
ncbi:MAG: phenylalanine--tRNA ligase subunit beta [Planctomycetota bacterium]